LNLIAPSGGVVAGTPYLIGAMVVIPKVSADAGALTAFYRGGGVFEVPKDDSTAMTTVGAAVDWDPDPGEAVAAGNVTGNFTLGYVVEAAAEAATTVEISLPYAPVTVQAGGG